MKKIFLICTFCLVGASTTYLSAKSSMEEVVFEKEIKVEEKVNTDCISYALGFMDGLEAMLRRDIPPHEYNELFNGAEAMCEEEYNSTNNNTNTSTDTIGGN